MRFRCKNALRQKVLQTNVTGFVSAACRLKGTAPLTAWPYCSCSGLCAGVSPCQKPAVRTEAREQQAGERSRRSDDPGGAAAVASSEENKPGQRGGRVFVWEHIQQERSARSSELRGLILSPGLQLFRAERASSGHDRVYSLETAHWKLSGRVAWTRVRGLSMSKWMSRLREEMRSRGF